MKNYINKGEATLKLNSFRELLNEEEKLIVSACQEIIDSIETEDLQPVERGEWIDVTDEEIKAVGYKGKIRPCKCSLCGQWYVGSDEFETFCNFCSSCGADMRSISE